MTDGRAGRAGGGGDAHAAGGGRGSPDDLVRVMLRPIASSAPLAFFAFGVGTVLYTALQLQWVPLAQAEPLTVILLAFVAPLEIITGLIAFAARDGGLATIMLMFGAVWTSIAITMRLSPPGGRSAMLGIFLLTVAAMLVAMSSASARTRPLLFVLALLAATRFTLSGVYEINGSTAVEHASGWVGIPIVAIALYAGTAFLLEDTMRRTVLPVARRRTARTAIEGDLSQQVQRVTQEAGVRQQL
ncbi:GPR1/FUN34/YaaH family transporter [Actinomadura verrucosospora]|uniref:GPR1/FUN34/YaaH family transporter n=1 Tax=Actinomadura verrucosospora TaxID=46165 RepID=UPI00156766F1|nr:GPR1/FUN34/YaaH family transporter [Actinomadura verrucosospora]